MKRDPELIAIVGVLIVALVSLVGYFVLAWRGVELPAEVLGLSGTAIGGVLGWATRSMVGDPAETPAALIVKEGTDVEVSKYPYVNPPEFKE